MLGFVRKREAREIRRAIGDLEVKELRCQADMERVRGDITEIERRMSDFWCGLMEPLAGLVIVTKKVDLILDHLNVEVKDAGPSLCTRQSPPAKANKRTAKKANGGDEESG